MNTDDYSTHVMNYLADLVRDARKNAADCAHEDCDSPMLTYFAGLADGIETALESLKGYVKQAEMPTMN